MGKPIRVRLLGSGFALAILLTACMSSTALTPVPTLTLIPPTATDTPTPVTPTPTRVRLPGPADLITPTLDANPVLIPAAAQPVLQRVLDDLADRLSIPAEAILLLRIETAVWTSPDVGCGSESPAGTVVPETEGFRFILQAGDRTYDYHTDTNTTVRLCEGDTPDSGLTEELLLDVDPVAADMVSLAQRRLADELDLAARRIRVIDVMPVTWTDSSLGCPQPGETYPPITIEGYRIVLAAGDDEYIFHSDSTQVIACDARTERLPVAE
ncbi:MAG: hypothetical protein K8J31_17620 [Anaerolineae bacterium]|nr:hypothetical protein [Anaerolineae bacterium]